MREEHKTYVLNEKEVNIIINYSQRKTMAFKVLSSTTIQIKAPEIFTYESILPWIGKREEWLSIHMEKMRKKEIYQKTFSYEEGSKHKYIGKDYVLKINSSEKDTVHLQHNAIVITTSNKEKVGFLLEKWYKMHAVALIHRRIHYYQRYFELKPTKVQIKDQKKRWGSCNTRRELRFNWRLIKAPIEVVDYVVVHEMCHMIHMNHSKKFWSSIEVILHDYKVRKQWLNDYGYLLFEH